jgi:hypothetical protein
MNDHERVGPAKALAALAQLDKRVQFDGHTWQPIGDVIENAFSAGGRK